MMCQPGHTHTQSLIIFIGVLFVNVIHCDYIRADSVRVYACVCESFLALTTYASAYRFFIQYMSPQ